MKTPIKIILLVLAAVAVVAAVAIYYRTVMAPPARLALTDPYTTTVEQGIARIDNTDDHGLDSVHRLFFEVNDLMAAARAEKLIDAAAADTRMTELVTVYVPKLKTWSDTRFSRAVWLDHDIAFMGARAGYLRSLKTADGTSVVTASGTGDALKSIESTLAMYAEARRLSGARFSGADAARSTIARAAQLRKTAPLSNNTSLVAALAEVPGRIADGHWNYLSDLVNRLYAPHMSDAAYSALVSRVENAFREYDNVRAVYGSSARSTTSLKERANDLIVDHRG